MADNDLNDDEMVSKKEDAIGKRERKSDIRDAINGDYNIEDCTDTERIRKIERISTERTTFVDELAADELQLARRILKIGRQMNTLELEYIDVIKQLDDIKNKAKKLKKDEEDFDVRREHNADTKRDLILRIIGYAIPIMAIIAGILIAKGMI